jgi:hypothetical protein
MKMVHTAPVQILRCRQLLDGLSTLLSIDYDTMYLPLMKECGLVMMCPVNNKSITEIVIVDAPCITKGSSNNLGYTSNGFFHRPPFVIIYGDVIHADQ